MTAVRVPWSSASFLAYLGGITVLAAILALLGVQSGQHGAGGFVFWAMLLFVVLAGAAEAARIRGHFVTGGLLAISAVASFVILVGAILDWFGWLPNTKDDEVFFNGFHFWLLVLELIAVVAAAVALRRFRFPLLVFVLAAALWSFVFDLLSNGGGWAAIVSIAVGLAFLLAGIAADDGPSRPFGFWLHVAAGLAIGGGLLWFFHDGDFDWIVIAVIALVYVVLGNRLGRSSWVVLAAWGMLQTASHFADKWSSFSDFYLFPLFPFIALAEFDGEYGEHHAHEWTGPVTFAVTGLVFIAIAIFLARRSRPPLAEI
jgi:MFS family permease